MSLGLRVLIPLNTPPQHSSCIPSFDRSLVQPFTAICRVMFHGSLSIEPEEEGSTAHHSVFRKASAFRCLFTSTSSPSHYPHSNPHPTFSELSEAQSSDRKPAPRPQDATRCISKTNKTDLKKPKQQRRYSKHPTLPQAMPAIPKTRPKEKKKPQPTLQMSTISHNRARLLLLVFLPPDPHRRTLSVHAYRHVHRQTKHFVHPNHLLA